MNAAVLASILLASTRILFVGNSYTYGNGGLWYLVKEVYDSVSADTLESQGYAVGGASFQDHWSDPALREALETQQLDMAVFQEQSCMPVVDPRNTYLYGDSLAVLCSSEGIQPAFLMTWARKNDPLMLEGLSGGYSRMGFVHQCPVAPCGAGFEILRRNHPEIDPYAGDGAHPSVSGSYLAACIVCSSVLGADISGESVWVPPGITAEEGQLLRLTAVEACSLYTQPMETASEI